MIVAHPSVPARNVKDLIALARARPGQLSYASSGNFLYFSGALFTSMARVEMLHVPFKGGAQAMPAVMSGEVATSFATIVSAQPHASRGKLRGLAVTSAERFRHGPGLSDRCGIGSAGLRGGRVVRDIRARRGRRRRSCRGSMRISCASSSSPDVRELFLKQGATPMRRARRSLRGSCSATSRSGRRSSRSRGPSPTNTSACGPKRDLEPRMNTDDPRA